MDCSGSLRNNTLAFFRPVYCDITGFKIPVDWDFLFIRDSVQFDSSLSLWREAPGSSLAMAALVKPYASLWQIKLWTCDAACNELPLSFSYLTATTGKQLACQKSWLSSISYCVLCFLAVFPNNVYLFILLVLLVDHWKYLRSVWEMLTQKNYGLVFLWGCSPTVSLGH